MYDLPSRMYSTNKQEGSQSFSTSPASFFASSSVDSAAAMSSSSSCSDWDSSSNFSRYDNHSGQSSSVSPASSISSSPALHPDRRLSPIFDELSLGSAKLHPSGTDVATYASQIIRNEAYALLALAARIAPATSSLKSSQTPAMTESTGGIDQDAADQPRSLHSNSISGSRVQESRTSIAFRAIVDQLSSLPPHGKIVVTGVGKSGIAGRKLVATFCSLGIQSVFLHPLEALHGDLGVICPCSPSSPCDALLMISHSGATAELMRLLPIVRPRVRALVAVTRDPDSVLARSCTHWLDAGTGAHVGPTKNGGHNYTDEADSLLPAPTSSVVSVLAAGDALALTLSRLKLGWDADGKSRRMDFLRCHPGGQLGIELGREGRGVEPSGAAMAAAASTTPSPTSALNTASMAPARLAAATVA